MITLKSIKNLLVWLVQRRKRGFDDPEIWELCDHLALYIAPRLETLADNMNSYNPGFSSEEWFALLYKMADAFRLSADNPYYTDKKSAQLTYKYIQDGLDLFSSYFQSLWD